MSLVSSVSNKEKSIHGQVNHDELESILSDCLQNGFISDYQKKFRIGNPEVSNSEQFYAPFMIQFSNRNRWIIFATTSMRTDRIKGQQWDAFNIKELDTSIIKAFLTYPSDADDVLNFQRQNDKYINNEEISALDGVISFDELISLIKQEFYNDIQEEITIDDNLSETALDEFLTRGKIWDKEGKSFEKQIANILSSKEFLNTYKNGKTIKNNNDFSFFTKLIQSFNLNIKNISYIKAYSDKETIGYLPSGGSPKTDVIAEIFYNNNKTQKITISCKRSKHNSVSVHQYSADVFAKVLDKNNNTLRKLLNDFQYYGNAKDLPDDVARNLEKELKPYIKKLILWAIGGIGAEGNPDTQWAQYIVSYNTTDSIFSVHSIEEYCNLIIKRKGAFGTPFNWTYASKHRGKSIQLKAPLV